MATLKKFFKTKKKDTGCTIEQYTGSDSVVEIPAEFGGVPVTEIGWCAFQDCTSLTQITIPVSVTTMGSSAFNGCTGLADSQGFVIVNGILYDYFGQDDSITLPVSVTIIGRLAFRGCTNLTQITIPQTVSEIWGFAFSGCTSLRQVVIPQSMTWMAGGAFFDCTSLTEITIPDGVTRVDDSTFQGCTKLKQAIIPEGVAEIRSHAFSGCTKLTQITIPASVTVIEMFAFSGCTKLTQITIPASVTVIEKSAFSGCTKLKKVVVENSKCKIDKSAFKKTKNLTNLAYISPVVLNSFPLERLLSMVQRTFSVWATLSQEDRKTVLSYVKKKKTLKKELFQSGDAAVISILIQEKKCLTLDEVNQLLDDTIVQGRTAITAMLLDYKNKNFEKAVQDAKTENEELVEVGLELPTLAQLKKKWRCGNVKGGTYIYNSYKRFWFPNTDKGIRISGYKGSEIHETIPKKTKDGKAIIALGTSKDASFQSLHTLTIEAGLQYIDERTFADCTALTHVNIPEGVTTIGAHTFQNCTSLRQIIIPASVTCIGLFAFAGCTSLSQIDIPSSVKTINACAFSGCTSLVDVTLPKSTEIDSTIFRNCPFQPPEN